MPAQERHFRLAPTAAGAVVTMLIALLLPAGAVIAAEPAASPSSTDALPTSAVLLAPARPVFVKLAIQVDGKPLAGFRRGFTDELFASLDKNKDGAIDATEVAAATAVPSPGGDAKADWHKFDTSPKDSKLSPDEFRSFAVAIIGPPIAVIKHQQNADEASNLFRLLDVNRDGALSVDELQRSRESLAFLDSDDDETISIMELNNAPEKSTDSGNPSLDVPPLLVIGPENTTATIAEQLLQRYDASSPAKRDRALDAAELGCATQTMARFDADRNQKLDAAELAKLVAEIVPELTISVVLFDKDRGRPSVSVSSTDPSRKFEVRQSEPDNCILTIDALQTTLIAKRTRSSTGDSKRFYEVRFRLSDKDNNKYLDAKEFASLALKDATFDAVDADKNGQVTLEELTRFVSKESAAPMNQVIMEATDGSKPLFDFLDTRADRRLSARELMSAASRLAEIDGNKDGRLTAVELTTRLGIEVSVKRPAQAQAAMAARPIRERQASAAVPRDRGPAWFLRMDRNYDGDVSVREFLGPRAVFDRLDADRDGLLSPEEAAAAK